MVDQAILDTVSGIDPAELEEWYESIEDILNRYGPERLRELLVNLQERAYQHGVRVPFTANTPYINTIHHENQPVFPGDLELERRIKSIVRWNAMAMVHKANKNFPGVGGHISTFASSASLYEIGQNHFFHGRTEDHTGDLVYFQGHASPGMYSRAFLEGRLTEDHLDNFRRELPAGGGLSSYPHPWLMPDFWQFPTVSMGLGPICSIYQARFLRYLEHRGLLDTSKSRVWSFVGDGETDEPETLGALTLASREKLDNLTWVVNCNLQRLDGPVRGNGKIIQELEAAFRGAGWNVIKVIWGNDWDALLEEDENGKLVKRMGEIVDGQYQKYSVKTPPKRPGTTTSYDSTGQYIREHFFGVDEELEKLVEHLSDADLHKLRRGGHDPVKIYAAYDAATKTKGAPTVVLAKTIKGYGLGESGEGRNTTHNEKKLNDEELRNFRSRFAIPVNDEDVYKAPFYRPADDSPEMKYLKERREALGGYLPSRKPTAEKLDVPPIGDKVWKAKALLTGTGIDKKGNLVEASTTMSLGQILRGLIKHKGMGERVVPIIPDEARTFGMDDLFNLCGIYASTGQLYEPVDSDVIMKYKEAKDGQLLEEGINEAGAMGSFIAAGSAYANLGINMVPFYVYYSMFGFQRVGDQIWCAADTRVKGFLCGGTSGRTTLNGEGLQHEDGHSQLVATTVPAIRAYDPAYGFELAVIVQDGLQKMYVDGDEVFYYLSVYNGNYVHPDFPAEIGTPDADRIVNGIRKGLYKFKSVDGKNKGRPQLFGSGPMLNEALRAQEILAEQYGIGSDVWSVTSYSELCREAMVCQRWNQLHPDATPKVSFLEETLAGIDGPFISTSDNVKLVGEQIRQWIPGDYTVMGTDGFGRSETREELRRHFMIDAECTTLAALEALQRSGVVDNKVVAGAVKELGIDPEQVDALYA